MFIMQFVPSTGSREGRESSDKRWSGSCKNIVYSIWSARSSFRYAMQISVLFITFGVSVLLLLTTEWCSAQKIQEPYALLPESLLKSGRSGVAAIDLRDLLHYFFLAKPFVAYPDLWWFCSTVIAGCVILFFFVHLYCNVNLIVSKSCCCCDDAMHWSKLTIFWLWC